MAAANSRRVPRAERERQMLDAAVAVFARRGYRAASMDEIAEAAGVSKPLVYLYLNSKDELFSACIRREAAALTAAVRDAVEEGATPERQLWSGLLGFFEHAAVHPDGWTLLYSQARTVGEPFAAEVAVLRAEIVAFVAALIAAACGSRDVEAYAHALVGAAESLAGWAAAAPAPAPTGKELAASLMTFAWSGLSRALPAPDPEAAGGSSAAEG
ncbi:TetR/AcrR family transcriptional regulator [Streptomyces cocklensis]|uniref:Transcriptional regulator, TetR family n=1 Tax=Actinacidiphila cocklensis TaxID=887465 RepID=A0A9W4EBJ4_9ACTN|nr:TetR/AcrR family transcriptional regulator [Actinacidiphila cocklensis]MDD1061136.1 TetR/AcrR family transcriptional regulator [Actinacidiphila cocklensis]CAG6398629.1 Transcriptional regulator, TetR family [Actinacidiphila cocklensis]